MRQIMQKLNTRFLALVMAVALLLCMTPAVSAAEDSGTCGKNLKWSLSGDTLTITGSGAMSDFPESTMAPWYAYRRSISAVRLPDGLTHVGDLAFYGLEKLETVILPDSVTSVGWHAFDGCTGMTMLDLGDSLKTIEDGAFQSCTSLTALRLPSTLRSIGFQGFYRCESLKQITVPSSVTAMGASAFAFCYQLISADIQARLTTLPEWTFYGCSNLNSLTLADTMTGANEYAFYDCDNLHVLLYDGASADRQQLESDIRRDRDKVNTQTVIRDEKGENPPSSFEYEETPNGAQTNEKTTTQTGNASVSTDVTITYPESGESSSNAKVDVTLENNNGWNEVADKVTEIVQSSDKTSVDVYIKDDSTLAGGALTDLAGTNSTVTVHNASGSVWKIDCTTLEADATKDVYDLSYERTDATQEQLEMMGCTVGYQIRFASNAQINAEVLIKLPIENARKNASLYHIKFGGKPELLQTVVVDNDGYAHFYLARVERGTQYLIGIDVQSVKPEEAIVPEVLFLDFGVTDNVSDMEYVVTGRTSSWGLNFGQVTWIMIGVMLTVVVAVGLTMYGLNKRKLRMGYIPDLDEEYEL